MRQIWITRAGPPEVLEVKEAPDPEPKAGEVRIRVEATGVNFADIMGRIGVYPDLPPMPVVPGYEVSGRVDAVGAGVDLNWAGRDVIAADAIWRLFRRRLRSGQTGFARPPGMSALEAAALPVNYFTAWQLIVVMGGLEGERNCPRPFSGRRRRHRRDADRQAYRRPRHRHGVRGQTCRTARPRRGSSDRLSN